MSQELQSLLEKIRKDGVQKAETEAHAIVSAAQEKAAGTVRAAEKKAQAALQQAEQDAAAFADRGRKSLEQAARDVILSVGAAVSRIFGALARREVARAMTGETLQRILTAVVESYCKGQAGRGPVRILLSPDQQREVADFLMHTFGKELQKGIEVKGDDTVISGFRVAEAGHEVQHDFTAEAIAEALSELVRPELAEIVRSALRS